MGENRAGVHTCIPGEGAQCRIVEKERDSENREYRSVPRPDCALKSRNNYAWEEADAAGREVQAA